MLNEIQLNYFKKWLEIEESAAEQNFLEAEEDSIEEEHFYARRETLTEVIEFLGRV